MHNVINVFSEIAPLKTVLLHRPGKELLNLTPDTLQQLLFDDIPFLKVAAAEHDTFARILKENGAKVVYLEDLMEEVLTDREVKEKFLRQFIEEGCADRRYHEALFTYLDSLGSNMELVLKTMEGIKYKQIDAGIPESLSDLAGENNSMLMEPMPNLYFTRDPFAAIGNGISLNRMYFETRRRETIYGEYIFKYHPSYRNVKLYYDRKDPYHIEGGDILNLNAETIAVGISQRTEGNAIEFLAKHIFRDQESPLKRILAFSIPKDRSFMHLDTVFTQIDHDKFTIHPLINERLRVFSLERKGDDSFEICRLDDRLDKILAKELRLDHCELIRCGGDDHIASQREQWNDGSNTLCIAPGKILVYERNEITNKLLESYGIEVLCMPSSELSRGRGGPRCMSMPLVRE